MKGKNKVPSSGPARELLRSKGQFWTPGWVADAMVTFAAHGASALYDPGFGAGAFALAACRVCARSGRTLPYSGCDNDASALTSAAEAGVPKAILRRISHSDFFDVRSLPRGAS